MKWWRDARFGMFIHWGVYAVPAGEYKGQLGVPGWGEKVRKAYLLVNPRPALEFTETGEGVNIRLPGQAPDAIASVIVLETK